MTYYCKRHRDRMAFTFEGPDEEESGFWEHHRKVHGRTQRPVKDEKGNPVRDEDGKPMFVYKERRMGVL